MSMHPITGGFDLRLPFFTVGLCAGFPSPADDYADEAIDLSVLLMRNRPATFLFRVDGDSMVDEGIFHGDIVVVDRSLLPVDHSIVVAIVNGVTLAQAPTAWHWPRLAGIRQPGLSATRPA